jgi:four helix bundle protein
MKKEYKGFRDLIVYQKAYQLAVEIYELTRNFPKEEKYSLTDQIRRSSRSVPANIAEAWARRRYTKSFILKLVDSDGEASETTVWLNFSKDHNYITKDRYDYFIDQYGEVGKMLGSMIGIPDKFCY